MTTSLVKYQDSISGADVELSISEIKKNICPKATDQEAGNFLRLCQYMGLNPFVNDAYLIKYGDGPASMVVGKDAFTKRADAHPQFAGIESGVVIQRGDAEPVHRKGTLVLAGEVIVGGWAKVSRNDRKLDVETSVSFNEFSTGRSMWNKMPGTMIEKVAIVKSLRTAFPATFSGLYDQAEMGIDMSEELAPIDTGSSNLLEEINGERKVVEATGEGKPKVKPLEPTIVETVKDIVPSAVVIDEVPEIVAAAQELGAVIVEPPADVDELLPDTPYCNDHDVSFNWMVNPDTNEGRWVHQYEYEVEGAARKGWCVHTATN